MPKLTAGPALMLPATLKPPSPPPPPMLCARIPSEWFPGRGDKTPVAMEHDSAAEFPPVLTRAAKAQINRHAGAAESPPRMAKPPRSAATADALGEQAVGIITLGANIAGAAMF